MLRELKNLFTAKDLIYKKNNNISITIKIITMNYNEKKQEVLTNLCTHFKITESQLFSKSRRRNICDARSMYIYWLRTNVRKTFIDIGAIFNYDHTTIMHACTKIRNLMDTEREFHKLYCELPHYYPALESAFTSLKYKH